MEDLDFPICILKMNLQCCEDFPSRVNKLLRKVKGVYAITIDPDKGMILVSGTIDPQVLIKSIEKTGQSPQLYAYEKDPAKAKTRFRALLKRYAANDSQDEPPAAAATTTTTTAETFPVGPPTMMQPGMVQPGIMQPAMMPIFTLPRTNGPPGWLAPGPRPRLMVKYEQPQTLVKKPGAPYPFDFYEGAGFPKSESLFKLFSDDHAQPCTIM